MQYTTLGQTNLRVSRTSFGALPIQRVSFDEAAALLRHAYEAGMNFFDTARGYTDSEEKIAYALKDVRKNIIIASKASGAENAESFRRILETSLDKLQTDYIDIYQLHNPGTLPDPDDANSTYAEMVRAKEEGLIRHIGITQHKFAEAREAVLSGLYETMQYPLSMISNDADLSMIDLCKEHHVGLIAMKAICGGLLGNMKAAFAFLRQYENVVPIWGVQRPEELEEFLSMEDNEPELDDALWAAIESDRKTLADNFCRGCGYCLPCPADIPIPMAARMSLLLRRAPTADFVAPEWQEKMRRINNCTLCGACRSRCPYDLDTPNLLKAMLADYEAFIAT